MQIQCSSGLLAVAGWQSCCQIERGWEYLAACDNKKMWEFVQHTFLNCATAYRQFVLAPNQAPRKALRLLSVVLGWIQRGSTPEIWWQIGGLLNLAAVSAVYVDFIRQLPVEAFNLSDICCKLAKHCTFFWGQDVHRPHGISSRHGCKASRCCQEHRLLSLSNVFIKQSFGHV